MKRCTFLCGVALGHLAAPIIVGAQQAGKVPRIGILGSHDVPFWQSFQEGLRELGYREGASIALEYRPVRSSKSCDSGEWVTEPSRAPRSSARGPVRVGAVGAIAYPRPSPPAARARRRFAGAAAAC